MEPEKKPFKGDIDTGIEIDVDVDIDSDMDVSIISPIKGAVVHKVTGPLSGSMLVWQSGLLGSLGIFVSSLMTSGYGAWHTGRSEYYANLLISKSGVPVALLSVRALSLGFGVKVLQHEGHGSSDHL